MPSLEWRRAKIATMAKTTEHRVFDSSQLELRQVDAETLLLTGYASVYEHTYDMGWYVESVARSAGKRTLSENPDTQLLVNHTGLPLARTASGTLRLSEDDRGLYVEADLDPEDPDVKSLVRKMARGDISQMSFAFRVTADKWNEDFSERVIQAYSIHRGDVSVCNFGASEVTSASVRSAHATETLNGVIGVLEQRAGKTLSAATMDVLTRVLKLVADADTAVDEAQPLLAELMDVPNPDSDEAGDSVERSINGEKSLCAAIRAVVREPGHDERRAEIIKRAHELDRPALIPEAWRSDGSLTEDRALGTPELRETYNDTYTALQGALDDKLGTGDMWDYYYCWVQDFDAERVYYYAGGDIYAAPYTLTEGGPVTIGDPVKVRPVTEYVEQTSERDAEPPEKREIPLPDFTTRAKQEFELLMLREGKR